MKILRRVHAEQSGFSLPELIVAMALFAVVMTMIVGLFTSFTTRFTEERAATDSAAVGALGMNEVTKVIRAGTLINRKAGTPLAVFNTAKPGEIVMYSYLADDASLADGELGSAPVMVRLRLSATGELTETRWNATRVDDEWIFPALTATPYFKERVIARKIIQPTTAQIAAGRPPLFTFLKLDGTALTGTVAATALKDIATVKVTMTVQADPTGRADPVQIQNRVGLPNLVSSRLGLEG